ncbi:MAG TPA: hypothetical protein VN786_00970 [Acidimicrobiales bacterium]|nr:hypothetical protein [Acidimicrobiales bacterium]
MTLSNDDDDQVSYMALTRGTPVASSSGTQFGTVEHVLQVPELDLFDGIVVKVHRGHRFVDRDQIDKIRRSEVRTLLSDEEAANLPKPSGTPVEVPQGPQDLGSSWNHPFARMFGREHWVEKRD